MCSKVRLLDCLGEPDLSAPPDTKPQSPGLARSSPDSHDCRDMIRRCHPSSTEPHKSGTGGTSLRRVPAPRQRPPAPPSPAGPGLPPLCVPVWFSSSPPAPGRHAGPVTDPDPGATSSAGGNRSSFSFFFGEGGTAACSPPPRSRRERLPPAVLH